MQKVILIYYIYTILYTILKVILSHFSVCLGILASMGGSKGAAAPMKFLPPQKKFRIRPPLAKIFC